MAAPTERRRWEREQARLKAGVVEQDTEEWQKDPNFTGLERVGGVDLSYVKGDDTSACASLVVLSYPALQVLYEDCRMVAVTAPYVAGFLAFREVPFLVEAVQRLQQEEPKLRPQVLLVDGNGLLHHRDSFPAEVRRYIPIDRHFRESPGHGAAELQQQLEAPVHLRGAQGEPGHSRAPRQVLLQVPRPGAHPAAKRRLNWRMNLMPEEPAGLLFAGSSPSSCILSSAGAWCHPGGQSHARPCPLGQCQPCACPGGLDWQSSFCSRIVLAAVSQGLVLSIVKIFV
ncbi:endonuclease V isoform X2 [Pseudopipra pipra]|uniref:endonuclease V isoform X2 n=1 Tax=Pseudopipra pipra TaxID=415032 RepID=UPI003138CC32